MYEWIGYKWVCKWMDRWIVVDWCVDGWVAGNVSADITMQPAVKHEYGIRV